MVYVETDEIARAATGDARAQSSLVNRHMPQMYALARRMLGDDHEAEDVTQDAFVRAWKALPAWEPRAQLSTWLHRVTLNLCYDRLRKRREVTGADDLPERVDGGLRPDQVLDQAQTVSRIEAAIEALPERQRAAITLCALQGRGNIEAAEIMDTTVEAMEGLLGRARRKLKQVLNEQEASGE